MQLSEIIHKLNTIKRLETIVALIQGGGLPLNTEELITTAINKRIAEIQIELEA